MNHFKICSKTKPSKEINEDYHFFSEKNNMKFGGIFDGHGGPSISKYFCENIKQKFNENPNMNICETLADLQKYCRISSNGTTVLLYRITFTSNTSGEIEVVWCGDSRGILYSVNNDGDYSLLFTTSDHTSSSFSERKRHIRICKENNTSPATFILSNRENFCPIDREDITFDVYSTDRKKISLPEDEKRFFKYGLDTYRMNGYLCPSRIFGHKINSGNELPNCCYIPDLFKFKFDNLNENINIGGFFASDGVWDVMTSKSILELIKGDKYNIDTSCDKILTETYKRWTGKCIHALYKYRSYFFSYPDMEIGESDDITFISFLI